MVLKRGLKRGRERTEHILQMPRDNLTSVRLPQGSALIKTYASVPIVICPTLVMDLAEQPSIVIGLPALYYWLCWSLKSVLRSSPETSHWLIMAWKSAPPPHFAATVISKTTLTLISAWKLSFLTCLRKVCISAVQQWTGNKYFCNWQLQTSH